MDAVILFSHGSVLCGSGLALEAHARWLRERGLASVVEIGYLNYSEPPFSEAVRKCAEAGANRIVIVPYFLVPGKFVKVDLPKAVDAARANYANIAFVMAAAIGFDESLADALIESARAAAPPECWREDLDRAVEFCRADPQCPLHNTESCPRRIDTAIASASHPSGLIPRTSSLVTQASSLGPQASTMALLVLVHGSPRPTANADMFRVLEVVRQRGAFPIVEAGFLECNEPAIPEAIDRFAAQGAERIVAVPYFLHTGTHVADDLPTLLEAGRERHPHVEFGMGPYLGRSPILTDLLEARARAAMAAP